MSKLTVGQRVTVHFPDIESARSQSLHVIDENQAILGDVVFVHEDETVNVYAVDHVGTSRSLLYVQATKNKDGIYVSAHK